jgi:cytochrome oxidase assembly protein ShyY1
VAALLRTPRWIGLTALGLALIVAFGALSWWQWQRAQTEREAAPPVPVAEVLAVGAAPAEEDFGIRVRVTGTYDASEQVIVAHGPSAYWVLTPLLVDGGPAVPVARGQVSSPEDPFVDAVTPGVVEVVGFAQPYEGDPGAGPDLPPGQVDRLTATAFSTGYPLVDGWVALESQTPAPTVTAAPVRPPLGVSAPRALRWQNASYAVQWVLFAGFVVFLWVRMFRDDLRESRGESLLATPAPSATERPEVY